MHLLDWPSVRNCEQCGLELEADNPTDVCRRLHRCDECDTDTDNTWTSENELLCDTCLARRKAREEADALLAWSGIESWEVVR